ncbi:DUF1638 domain-containing protein [Pseudoramibacter sp. HA2172]|uniref:DUF1638 domain-containing protein n=1 Tax=Pseudoramibacter faecis TaxID=3108534 RepID=UPI002E7A8781|nr:DUF1638 domain-containing protein [Pseudoramibacter sp. HA2172]
MWRALPGGGPEHAAARGSAKKREAAVDALDRRTPKDRDTVLVAQGYCGGVWEGIAARQKIVIPRFDDCVSIALTTPIIPI